MFTFAKIFAPNQNKSNPRPMWQMISMEKNFTIQMANQMANQMALQQANDLDPVYMEWGSPV